MVNRMRWSWGYQIILIVFLTYSNSDEEESDNYEGLRLKPDWRKQLEPRHQWSEWSVDQ